MPSICLGNGTIRVVNGKGEKTRLAVGARTIDIHRPHRRNFVLARGGGGSRPLFGTDLLIGARVGERQCWPARTLAVVIDLPFEVFSFYFFAARTEAVNGHSQRQFLKFGSTFEAFTVAVELFPSVSI